MKRKLELLKDVIKTTTDEVEISTKFMDADSMTELITFFLELMKSNVGAVPIPTKLTVEMMVKRIDNKSNFISKKTFDKYSSDINKSENYTKKRISKKMLNYYLYYTIKEEKPSEIISSSFSHARIIYRLTFWFSDFKLDCSIVKSVSLQLSDKENKGILDSHIIKFADMIDKNAMIQIKKDPTLFPTIIPNAKDCEYEVEVELINKKFDVENLFRIIKIYDYFIFRQLETFKTEVEFDNAIDYSSVYNKVKDLTKETMNVLYYNVENPKGYAVSYKKDGIRTSIYLNDCSNIVFSKEQDMEIIMAEENDELRYSLFDAEFIPELDKFYFFDCPIFAGKLISSGLLERLELVKKFKPFADKYFSTELSVFNVPSPSLRLDKLNKMMLDEEKKLPFVIDGLIFTSVEGKYKDVVYRWKPQERTTIDFIVEFNGKINGYYNYVLYSYISDKDIAILLKSNKSKIGDIKKVKQFQYSLIQFGSIITDYQYSSAVELVNYGIYEFRRDVQKKKWTMMRYRETKDLPNYYNVAKAIYDNNILNPITKEEITEFKNYFVPTENIEQPEGEKIRLFKNFHSFVKKKIFGKYIYGGKLFDVGTGRANDMHKWRESNITEIVGVEKNEENIKEAKNRLDQPYNLPFKYNLINLGIFEFFETDTTKYKEYFDYATIFFTSHYFLKTKEDYEKYAKSINSILKPGGKVIYIDINGKRAFDILKKNNGYIGVKATEYDNSAYEIKLAEPPSVRDQKRIDTTQPTKFGLGIMIDVYVSTIRTWNRENLVDLDLLEKTFEDNGFILTERKPFEEIYNSGGYKSTFRDKNKLFDKTLMEISFLNEYFVYTKKT